jgi:hypothetical protein
VASFSRSNERFFAPIKGVAEAVERPGHHPRVQTRAFAVLALGCHRCDHRVTATILLLVFFFFFFAVIPG